MRHAAIALAALFAVLALSCKSVQRDKLVETVEPEAYRELDSYELGLVEAETASLAAGLNEDGRALVEALGRELAAAETRGIVDEGFEARRRALMGRAAFILGDKTGAKAELQRSLKAKKTDELAVVLAALLSPTDADALAALDSAPESEEGNRRVKAERGYRLLALGRARDAIVAFDDSLPFLPQEYSRRYGDYRERAVALRDAPAPASSASGARLAAAALTLADLCAIAQENTTLLDGVTGGRRWEAALLFDRLKTAGYFAGEAPTTKDGATRADAALFLWNALASYRGDSKLLTKYTMKYSSRANPASPVPDVPIGSSYFDAVLGCVELEIMKLVDGRNFAPDAAIDGAAFFAALGEADRRK